MRASASHDFLAQMKCSVDVIALMPKLSQTSRSCQKQHGFTEVFLHCASKARVEQNQLGSVRPITRTNTGLV